MKRTIRRAHAQVLAWAAAVALSRVCVPCVCAQSWQYAYDSAGNLLVEAAENPLPPQITSQPRTQVLEPGDLAAFSIMVAQVGGVTFQWQFNGASIAGATQDTLLLTNPSVANLGQYSVVVSNSYGSVTSAVAWLAAARTWIGAINSDWFNPGNWNPIGVPATNDVVNFATGTINLSAPVTINGQFNWSGGILSGSPLSVASNALMILSGATKSLYCPVTNAGTVLWAGGDLDVENVGTSAALGAVENLPGGLWDIQCDQTMYTVSSIVDAYFHNAGSVRKSAGPGTTKIAIPFFNSGGVTVLQGTLELYGGGTVEGAFSAASGAGIVFAWGSFTSAVPAVITGPGFSQFTGETLTLLSDAAPNLALAGGTVVLGPDFQGGAITNLTLAGSTLAGTNILSGIFNWSAGQIAGPLTVATNGLLNLGAGLKYLSGPLTNAGTVLWTGGDLVVHYLASSGILGSVENLVGALWDIQCDQIIYDDIGAPGAYFHNAGLLRKSAGPGTSKIAIPLLNSGAVALLQGTLELSAGGTIEGAFSTATGTAIVFAEGTFTSGVPAIINGPGSSQFTGGSLTLLRDVMSNLALAGGSVLLGPEFQDGGAITNLALAGSTLAGTNTLSGVFNWSAGQITGPLTVATNGLMNLSGDLKYLSGPLTNAGTVLWAGGDLVVQHLASSGILGSVENLAGALWDIQCDQRMYNDIGAPGAYFHNMGLVRKSAASGVTTCSIPFLNSGAVTLLQGTVSLNGGDFTQGGGAFSVSLGGTNSGQFGQLICGNATLGAPLIVTLDAGFTPPAGAQFQILSASNLTGTFAANEMPAGMSVGYGTSGVLLTATSVLGLMSPRITAGYFTFGFQTIQAQSYTVQTNVGLFASGWGSYTNLIGDRTFRQFAFPLPNPAAVLFFRLVEP